MGPHDRKLAAPRIRTLRFGGYRSLLDVTLRLQSRFTLVIGRNSTGKSTLLRAAHLACEATVPQRAEQHYMAGRFRAIFGEEGVESARTRGALGQPVQLGLATASNAFWFTHTAEEDATRAEWRVGLGPPEELEQAPTERSVIWESGRSRDTTAASARQSVTEALQTASSILQASAGMIATPTPIVSSTPVVRPDGFGVAGLLAHLADRDARSGVVEALARIVPAVQAIRNPLVPLSGTEEHLDATRMVAEAVVRTTWAHSIEVQMSPIGWVRAEELSEGTLVALAVLAIAHATRGPTLLLLDDLERGLHPMAQREIALALRALIANDPDLQILATTHSPYLLDEFDANEVIVAAMDDQGHTRVRSLADHPEWEGPEGPLRTGEFWSAVGEDWVRK